MIFACAGVNDMSSNVWLHNFQHHSPVFYLPYAAPSYFNVEEERKKSVVETRNKRIIRFDEAMNLCVRA